MRLDGLLFLLGVGFLAANLKALLDHLQYLRRRRSAGVVWPGPRPPFFQMQVFIGLALLLLVVYNVAIRRGTPFGTLFGETMMLVYYIYSVPIGIRIERGFYKDGVWTDRGFIRYGRIGGISWREQQSTGKAAVAPTLLLATKGAGFARSVVVPGHLYGNVRRELRDRIADNQIQLTGHPLDLGVKDDREDA